MKTASEFGWALKGQRYTLGMTQHQFCQKVGIRRHRLADFECGRVVHCDAYEAIIAMFPNLAMDPPPKPTGRGPRRDYSHVTDSTADPERSLATEFRLLRSEIKLLRLALELAKSKKK